MKTKELVTIAILAALLYIVQVAFSFLPNIELVSLLILIYTLVFDKMTLKIIAVFIILEGVQWGFGLWWWSYIYVWPILYFVVRWLKKFIRIDDSISWAVVLGFYGLFFRLEGGAAPEEIKVSSGSAPLRRSHRARQQSGCP